MNHKHYKIYTITSIEDIVNPLDDCIDVGVVIGNKRYQAFFMTIRHIETIMKRYRKSGDCAYGKYLWSVDLIIVKRLDLKTIKAVVEDIIDSGEIEDAFAGPYLAGDSPEDEGYPEAFIFYE